MKIPLLFLCAMLLRPCAVPAQIEALEKENKSLKRKLDNRDKKIRDLRQGMDLTKERRDRIRTLAVDLVDELQDSEWGDFDRYYK